jgi:hypothetical protein
VDPDIARGTVSIPHGFADVDAPNVAHLISPEHDIDPLTGMMLQAGVPLTLTPISGDHQHR